MNSIYYYFLIFDFFVLIGIVVWSFKKRRRYNFFTGYIEEEKETLAEKRP